MAKKPRMGAAVRCKVTGFEGVITGKTEYLNGCVSWLVKPVVDKEGKMVAGEWIDEPQLKVVKSSKVAYNPKPVGGPQADPPPFR